MKEDCRELLEKIDEIYIANRAMPNDESHGLSIYFPEDKDLYNKYIWSDKPIFYENLSLLRDTNWDEFLREYLRVE